MQKEADITNMTPSEKLKTLNWKPKNRFFRSESANGRTAITDLLDDNFLFNDTAEGETQAVEKSNHKSLWE